MDIARATAPDPTPFGAAVGPTRQQRSARTRERILDAAQAAFVENGIAAVSLRDVAARAGLTHPGVLRHYASREALLGAVVERLDDANAAWIDRLTESEDSLGAAALARRNAAIPGYLELFTALSGEATSTAHPAHALMRSRYERVRQAIARQLLARGGRSNDEALATATLLIAGWDGLQVQQRYAPEIELVELLAERERLVLGRAAPATAPAEADGGGARDTPSGLGGPIEPTGTPTATARRAAIVSAATGLFAADGFAGTSLSRIAERVGISKATLLHHIGSKDELLIEVLRRRDEATAQHDAARAGGAAQRGAGRLRSFADIADRTAAEDPGLVELYAVLSCEATTPGHAAHDYFARRFERMRRSFAELFEQARSDGELPGDRDPAREATWLLAVWDGLQIQSLYDPRIEVGALLRVHLGQTLH